MLVQLSVKKIKNKIKGNEATGDVLLSSLFRNKNLKQTWWMPLRTFWLTCVVRVTDWMTAEPFSSRFLLLFFSHSCPPFPSLSPLLPSLSSSSSSLGDSPGLTHQLNLGTCHNSFLPLIRSSSRRTQPDCGRLMLNLRVFNKATSLPGSAPLRPGGIH